MTPVKKRRQSYEALLSPIKTSPAASVSSTFAMVKEREAPSFRYFEKRSTWTTPILLSARSVRLFSCSTDISSRRRWTRLAKAGNLSVAELPALHRVGFSDLGAHLEPLPVMADSEELWTYPWLTADTVFPVSFYQDPELWSAGHAGSCYRSCSSCAVAVPHCDRTLVVQTTSQLLRPRRRTL